MKPNRNVLSCAMLAVALVAAASSAAAQQTTAAPCSPNATTTIDGKYLPAPPPKFGGTINMERQGLQAVLAAARRAAQGRAQRASHHDRRPGLRRVGHLRRRHPDAGAGPDRQGGASLHAVPLHLAVLADASGADHRAQPSLRGLRRDRRDVHGLSGLRRRHRTEQRDRRRDPQRERLRDVVVRQESQHAKLPIQPGGPFDQWPSGMGFDYFYGFMGGETDQWTPWLFRDHTQIFPWVGHPGYNLITDMADEAIKHMKGLE